jgi:hypothetical protein
VSTSRPGEPVRWMLEQPVCVPVWLGADEQAAWYEELWQGVAALQQRYPLIARVARNEWWLQPGACELLAAACSWRAGLDELNAQLAGAPEERAQAEWAFHQRLPGLVEALRWHGMAPEAPRTVRDPRPAFERFIAELVGRAGTM